MFGGKVTLKPTDTLETLQTEIKNLWSQRTVVKALGNFLSEHAPSTAVPKAEDNRIKLFWEVMLELR